MNELIIFEELTAENDFKFNLIFLNQNYKNTKLWKFLKKVFCLYNHFLIF